MNAPEAEHRAVQWRRGDAPELEEALLRSVDSESQADGSDLVSWTCPRCSQRHLKRVERDSTWAGLSADPHARSGELVLRCDCGLGHPERPEGEVGCGYRTVLVLEEEDA